MNKPRVTLEQSTFGKIAALWGFAGAFSLIAFAIWRLVPIVLESLTYPLNPLQWALLVVNIIFMAHFEGYKGFQKGFAPRVAARTLYLSQHPGLYQAVLAPLFVIGYFNAPRRRLITTYALTTMIISLMFIIHSLDQPWRGLFDAGVVVGLIWGLACMLYYLMMVIYSPKANYSPEIQTET